MQCLTSRQESESFLQGEPCSQCSELSVYQTLCKDHFCNAIERRVQDTITQFSLFSPDDKILVAYSGGKDSTVLLHILHALGYVVEAITLNAYIGCYSRENVRNAITFCHSRNIPLHHISFRDEFGYSLCYLRTLLNQKGLHVTSCTICGVLRRYLLNKRARMLGATKIAFGHNLDDETQAILMNVFKGDVDLSTRFGPQSGTSRDGRFVQRIKPLYFVAEEEIILYSKMKQFPVHYGACPCSVDSYRYFIRQLIKKYEQEFPQTRKNIVELFRSLSSLVKQETTTPEIPTCATCGEPSAHDQCRTCTLLATLSP